jgi:hypothetical protein
MPMSARQREEVLNVTLASLIAARGVPASPETITQKKMPDVIATFRGLRCAIEGKTGDVTNAQGVVSADARRRVEQGIAHLAIGVVYPKELRSTEFRVLPKPCLSNVWWPVSLLAPNDNHEKVLALWLNSTLGLTLMLGCRVPTRGPWVQFKKPTLKAMPILDFRKLSKGQIRILAAAFDNIKSDVIDPLPMMGTDPVRAAIDRAFEVALELPDISSLRGMLGDEPIISNTSLGAEAREKAEADQFELLFA